MVVFYPEFEAQMESCIELVVLVDLSNSMKGEASRMAKMNALLLLNLIIEAGQSVIFNVILFGTGSKELFLEPVVLNMHSLDQAKAFLEVQTTLGEFTSMRKYCFYFLECLVEHGKY